MEELYDWEQYSVTASFRHHEPAASGKLLPNKGVLEKAMRNGNASSDGLKPMGQTASFTQAPGNEIRMKQQVDLAQYSAGGDLRITPNEVQSSTRTLLEPATAAFVQQLFDSSGKPVLGQLSRSFSNNSATPRTPSPPQPRIDSRLSSGLSAASAVASPRPALVVVVSAAFNDADVNVLTLPGDASSTHTEQHELGEPSRPSILGVEVPEHAIESPASAQSRFAQTNSTQAELSPVPSPTVETPNCLLVEIPQATSKASEYQDDAVERNACLSPRSRSNSAVVLAFEQEDHHCNGTALNGARLYSWDGTGFGLPKGWCAVQQDVLSSMDHQLYEMKMKYAAAEATIIELEHMKKQLLVERRQLQETCGVAMECIGSMQDEIDSLNEDLVDVRNMLHQVSLERTH